MNLKKLSILLATCALISAPMAHAGAEPGAIDFGTFKSGKTGCEFVEVNLSANVLGLAARFAQQDHEVSDIIKGLHGIRVNVVGLDEENREDTTRQIETLRATLAKEHWDRLVTAQEKNDDVGVYLKTGENDTIAGVVVLVLHGNKQAVFVNVVGNISPDQLAALGQKLNIDPLKQLAPHFKK